MSKKIIYLLSLLMVLSLVFASCKKNNLNPSDVGGGIQNEDNSGETGDSGLYDDYTKIPDIEKPLITYKVFDLNGTETFRNSVVVPMGVSGNYIAVFSENRYTSTTSVNDIALDGSTITDIVYNLNTKAGKEGFWRGKQIVGGTITTDPKQSHAAIIVYKISDTEVVIVASYGAGISRVGQSYDNRGLKSGLQYIKGTLNEGTDTFTWGGWKDVTIDGSTPLSDSIEKLSFSDKQNPPVVFKQFGTHSARGVTSADGKKVYVPVVLANQGDSSTPKESMGNVILTGDFSSSEPTWKLDESSSQKIAFEQIENKNGFTKQKESRIYDVEGSTIKYLTVPSGSAASTDQFLFAGIAGQSPKKTAIQAGDGSVGLTKVKWYGSDQYTVSGYAAEMAQPNKMLVMHVANTESNLHIYLTDLDLATAANIRKYKVNDIGKASSIDVLKDGTIITLAEEGVAEGTAANQRKFNVVFKRYSQKYLDSILQ